MEKSNISEFRVPTRHSADGSRGDAQEFRVVNQESNGLGVLKEMIGAIREFSNTDEILNLIFSHVKHLFDPDVCTLCLCDGKKQFRVFAQDRKRRSGRNVRQILPGVNRSSISSKILSSTDHPRLIEDLRKHPGLRETCLGRLQVRSCICTPIRSNNILLGCFCVGSYMKDPGLFAVSHPDLLETLGSVAAIAIEKGNGHRNPQDPVISNGNGFQPKSTQLTIIGCDEELQSVLQTIGSVASSQATVLILGETGTGKELIARATHEWGDRASERFVAQNCATLPESLLESELFGHTKGSFTGAHEDKMGLFEIADGGTLFLDEIAEMTPRMQAILFRVVEDGEVRRIGGTETRKVNVRLIAATSSNLETLMEEKHFRRELFYRLAVITIQMPPLRNRKGDIPLLAQHFLSMYSRLIGKHFKALEPRALAALEHYNWPGNIRELKNEIHRAVILSEPGELLRLEAFSEKHWNFPAGNNGKPDVEDPFDESLRVAEARHIHKVLRSAGGTISRAAARLKIHRNTLARKVSDLGIRNNP